MELDDQNCWTIAEAIGHRRPYRLHHFLSRAVWDQELMLDIAAAWAAARLGDGDRVLIIDETGDAKSSADAAGAARQYSGSTGGVALCQGHGHPDLRHQPGAHAAGAGPVPAGRPRLG